MAPIDSSPLPRGSGRRRRKGMVRRVEQCCSKTFTNLPLAFVYGITTWAVYVEVTLSIAWAQESRTGYLLLLLGLLSYGLLNWSYTVAAFTDPGSPLNSPQLPTSSSRQGYSYLPTQEPMQSDVQSLTVKSSGGARYCKKCQTRKPDRAHHCSSCGRCVLKMDHHCPWLATCVGFRNYKPFILFCSYVTLFCWICFGVSGTYLWTKLLEADMSENALFGINTVLLVVLSGIFGLVLTGFTGWHISLAWRNQTTIECLEKTRYTSPIRKGLHRAQQAFSTQPGQDAGIVSKYGKQLTEMHANAIPGVTRAEEGEEQSLGHVHSSRDSDQLTAAEALRMNYNEMERYREEQRYEEYLDEQDSEKLPNAFDLGWRKNLELLFGEQKLFWFLPICNTIGDGWHWEPSTAWLAARDRIAAERQSSTEGHAFQGTRRHAHEPYASHIEDGDEERHYLSTSNGIASVPTGRRSPGKANQILGRSAGGYADEYFGDVPSRADMPLKTLRRDRSDDTSSIDGLYDGADHELHSSDDDGDASVSQGTQDGWRDWD